MVKVKENSGSQPTAAVKVVGLSVNMGLFQARIKARRGNSRVWGFKKGESATPLERCAQDACRIINKSTNLVCKYFATAINLFTECK